MCNANPDSIADSYRRTAQHAETGLGDLRADGAEATMRIARLWRPFAILAAGAIAGAAVQVLRCMPDVLLWGSC